MELPALNKARDKAYAISCTSNLKQQGLAFAGYANDNNDWLVPEREFGGGDNGFFWYRVLQNLGYCGNKADWYMRKRNPFLARESSGDFLSW